MNLLTDAEMYLRAVESRTQPPAEPTPCPSGELTLTEVPPCPACEAVQNGPYSISIEIPSVIVNDRGMAFSHVITPEMQTEAACLADRLEEQGCPQDAELVRRLAGVTGPGGSGPT